MKQENKSKHCLCDVAWETSPAKETFTINEPFFETKLVPGTPQRCTGWGPTARSSMPMPKGVLSVAYLRGLGSPALRKQRLVHSTPGVGSAAVETLERGQSMSLLEPRIFNGERVGEGRRGWGGGGVGE